MAKPSAARKALAGKPKTLAAVMKADKALDAKMTPAMIRKDIAADKKQLASKLKGKKK